MKLKHSQFVFRFMCVVYRRFPVQRALWMVSLYASEGLRKRRLSMLELDAKEMLRLGRQLDALRILHCALLLNPGAKDVDRLAREVMTKKWKIKSDSDDQSDKNYIAAHQLDLKMQLFSWYVMQAVERGGFAGMRHPMLDELTELSGISE